jgi:hypothetical protein
MNPSDNGQTPLARPAAPLRHAYAFEQNGRWLKTFCGSWVLDRELAQGPDQITCPACQAETDAFESGEL